MDADVIKQFKTGFLLFIVFTLITGIIYPMLVTVIAQLFFNWQANGSLINYNGKITGSAIIGQNFTDPKYFWGRPSATPSFAYDASHSTGSNLGPSNPLLLQSIKERVDRLHNADPENHMPVPVDLVTASASGLDPDISPLAAIYQAHRVAKARGLHDDDVLLLIQKHIKNRVFNVLGEPRINVIELNMDLDGKRI